jgi:TonB family protein
MVLVVALGAGVALGQDAGSAEETVAAPAKIYDMDPELVGPELLPTELTIPEADVCKSESDDEITLSLIVDANGNPRDVTVINPRGTPLERLALHIVEDDRFKPGTLQGEAVEVRRLVRVSLEGCRATKKDSNGNSIDVFRLRTQPVQIFGTKPRGQYRSPEVAGVPASQIKGVHLGGNGISTPVALNNVSAKYSEAARREGVTGACLVTLTVDVSGMPQNPRIVRSLGYGLDEKAIEAVKKYRFKPAMKDNVPFAVEITVEVDFSLD